MRALCYALLLASWFTSAMGTQLSDLHGKRLTKREVAEFLSDGRWQKDESLTKFFGQGNTYVHPKTRTVLMVDWSGKGGMLFPDKDAVYEVDSDPRALEPKHMLQGIFKYGPEFAKNAPQLSERFIGEIIPGGKQSEHHPYSLASIGLIDEFISAKGVKPLLQPEVFGDLLAYVGEVIKREMGPMEWRMKEVGPDLWEPWLVDPRSEERRVGK